MSNPNQTNADDITSRRYETLARRIRALFALAKDPGASPEEAATAAAKASELLTRYNLDLARIQSQPQPADYINERITLRVPKGPYVRAHRTLLAGLAKYNWCKGVNVRGTPTCFVIGARHNVETVRTLYELLAPELHRMAEDRWPASDSLRRAKAEYHSIAHAHITYIASYLEGAAETIWHRLRESRTKATAATNAEGEQTRALILVTYQQLTEAVQRYHGKLQNTRYRDPRDGHAYHQGARDAQALPIERQRQIS